MEDPPLVRICDLAGRPRGAGFVADDRGTVVTSHEAVDGLGRVVLHAPDGGATCVVGPEAVVELPEADLALVRTEGLGVTAVPVGAGGALETGAYVRIPAGGWREARVLGHAAVTYTATGRFHLLDGAMELAVGTAGADALCLGGGAAGGPVVDVRTGAVVAVLGTALQAGHQAAGLAVPLRAAAAADPRGPLAALLARNAATVPAYGSELNLAGVLQMAAVSVGSDGPGESAGPTPVERPDVTRELERFTAGDTGVLALVGDPGCGRTTELAAFAARRAGGEDAAPTVWLRGADLRGDDASVADAVGRALERAGRIVAASREGGREAEADVGGGGPGGVSPERVAQVARDAGRPLVLLLDGPEEMPPVLAHRLAAWSRGTERWLAESGVQLVVACRGEYWEQAGPLLGADVPHGAATVRLPLCVRVGDLAGERAREARERFGIPEGALAAGDAGHPLALRLLGEVRAAVPEGGPAGCPDRDEVFSAYLDLMCLRVAVRLAAPAGVRGSGVRRLAARVSGRVHEAARRCLGPGQGELDRETFEELFPWGVLGGVTGWASAVLAEGVLVPAGAGYRFAHEEVADWVQGMHLDLDAALDALVFRRRGDGDSVPVPRHRAGPVVRALLLVGRERGDGELGSRLRELVEWAGVGAGLGPDGRSPRAGVPPCPPCRPWRQMAQGSQGSEGSEGSASFEALWWAGHLVSEVLLHVPDAGVHLSVLEELADAGAFGAWFWTGLPVCDDVRFDLLRRLVVHDPEPGEGERHLDAVAELLAAEPARVQRQLTRWFDDERALPALPDATVATAAQALLHTQRHRGVDDLTEALVDRAHPRADELLAALADEEPSAVCRAVDRWAHDERPARHVAAMAYGLRAAPHVTSDADRKLLRYAALALLARADDRTPHGAALALLVRDPEARPEYLGRALDRFAAGDGQVPAEAVAAALGTHPEPVLAAFRERLRVPGPGPGAVLRALAEVTAPELARRVAVLVQELAEERPEAAAGHVAAFVDRRLEHGATARATVFSLVVGLLQGGSGAVGAALGTVLAGPGTAGSHALRAELLDVLLGREREPVVLDAVLCAAVRGGRPGARGLVHRVGTLMVRTPEGASRFDRRLVELARDVSGFATEAAAWLAEAPQEWASLVGPSTRRTIENLAGVRVPA
ncbi:serine protease [Streptomyces sp. SID8379]|uniref:trypsin-like peptidase domain-containing protein n=1 Tax=unclassified Streptomyces TaxID=2593676 RepID=UPI00037E9239|nr:MULTISPECIES: trypsin-like peptidase domain-containing protein [unclassified Streptomyces]MYW65413.1 serine protease [Streptomyces sp. SID8379]